MLGEPQAQKLSKEEENEQGLRESLQDAALVVEKLKPWCHSVDELLAVIKAALGENGDGQLRMIGTAIFGGGKK